MSEGTQFRVESGRTERDRQELILTGTVLEGILVNGMRTELPRGSEGSERMPAAVQEITMNEPEGGQPTNELVFFAPDEEQLRRWSEVEWSGRELTLGY